MLCRKTTLQAKLRHENLIASESGRFWSLAHAENLRIGLRRCARRGEKRWSRLSNTFRSRPSDPGGE